MIKWTSITKDNMEKEIFLANLISEEGLQNTCRQILSYHHHSRKKVLN